LRFYDLRHTVVTRLLEAGEPDHVVESIAGPLSRRMLEHFSHIRLNGKKRCSIVSIDQPSAPGAREPDEGIGGDDRRSQAAGFKGQPSNSGRTDQDQSSITLLISPRHSANTSGSSRSPLTMSKSRSESKSRHLRYQSQGSSPIAL
jgi:hypothetical protein